MYQVQNSMRNQLRKYGFGNVIELNDFTMRMEYFKYFRCKWFFGKEDYIKV